MLRLVFLIIIFGINSHRILTSLFKKKKTNQKQTIHLTGRIFPLYTLLCRAVVTISTWKQSSVDINICRKGRKERFGIPRPVEEKGGKNIPRFFTSIFWGFRIRNYQRLGRCISRTSRLFQIVFLPLTTPALHCTARDLHEMCKGL